MSPYLFILNTHCGVTFSLSQSFEWTGSQSAFDVAAKNTSSSAILDTDRLLFVNSAESAHRTLMTSSVRTSRKSVRSPLQNCFFGFFFGRSSNGKHKAMVDHNCHGKTENLKAKTKTSRQNQVWGLRFSVFFFIWMASGQRFINGCERWNHLMQPNKQQNDKICWLY